MRFILDGSALVKRYKREQGTDVLDEMFAARDAEFAVSPQGLTEVFHALYRLHKESSISDDELRILIGTVAHDIQSGRVICYPIGLEDAQTSLIAVREAWHSRPLNGRADSADCLFLGWICASFVDAGLPGGTIVVSADRTLLAIAAAIGLKTLNPADPGALDTVSKFDHRA